MPCWPGFLSLPVCLCNAVPPAALFPGRGRSALGPPALRTSFASMLHRTACWLGTALPPEFFPFSLPGLHSFVCWIAANGDVACGCLHELHCRCNGWVLHCYSVDCLTRCLKLSLSLRCKMTSDRLPSGSRRGEIWSCSPLVASLVHVQWNY